MPSKKAQQLRRSSKATRNETAEKVGCLVGSENQSENNKNRNEADREFDQDINHLVML